MSRGEHMTKGRRGGVVAMFRLLSKSAPCLLVTVLLLLVGVAASEASYLATRSAILIDAADGQVLYEQNADFLIPPASVTKILTLYLVFDAIKQGQVHPWDRVPISKRAANTGGSRMGLRVGKDVPLEELIKGVAVVSGNDAAVAVAEYLCGSVENFVCKMNIKAKQLGMTNSEFKTPNGLPANGQVTTARDLAKLSLSYIRHYPEALQIHSLTSYAYGNSAHHNANRLLGTCPGVDGIKTGFVCASGFNLAATAKRGDIRLIAVVMGARSPWVRTVETEKLLEAGFQKMASDSRDSGSVDEILAKRETIRNEREVRLAHAARAAQRDGGATNRSQHSMVQASSGKVADGSKTCNIGCVRHAKLEKKAMVAEDSCPIAKQSKSRASVSKQKLLLAKHTTSAKKTTEGQGTAPSDAGAVNQKNGTPKESAGLMKAASATKQQKPEKPSSAQATGASVNGSKQNAVNIPSKKAD